MVVKSSNVIKLLAVRKRRRRTSQYSASDRVIQSVYYKDLEATQIIKQNMSRYAATAVPNAIKHMQNNHYGAMLVEVHDLITGEVYAVIRSTVDGYRIIYNYMVKEGE